MNPEDASKEAKIPQTGEEQPLTLRIPETALIPDGATFYEGEDDTRCRLIRPNGERCRSTRMRLYGLCPGHAGQGGVAKDPHGSSRLGHEGRRKRSKARLTLGISARRAAQPLEQARFEAQLRAQDYADAIVTKPLDDPDLATIPRQQAAIRALELLYPQIHASVDVSMPEQEGDVVGMDWQSMQALAAQLTSQA